MQISVVIPLYNKVQYIERTIQSVCQQSFKDFEVIVVDDESTDGSDLLVEQLQLEEPRIRLFRRSNGGQSAARNSGIAAAKGELVAFLDADDQWEPDYLQALVDLRQEFPEAGLYATGYRVVREGFDVEVTIPSEQSWSSKHLLDDYFKRSQGYGFVWVSAMAIPKQILGDLGGFLEGEQIGGDTEMISRVAMYYPVAYDSRPLAVYRADALGRQNPRRDRKPQSPPFSRTFAQAKTMGQLSEQVLMQAPEYINRRWLDYTGLLIALGKRDMIRIILQEEITQTKQYRFKVWFLRLAVLLFPMSLLQLVNRMLTSRYLLFLHSARYSRCGVQVRLVKK